MLPDRKFRMLRVKKILEEQTDSNWRGAEPKRRRWRMKRGGSLVSKECCRTAEKTAAYCEPDRASEAQRDGVRHSADSKVAIPRRGTCSLSSDLTADETPATGSRRLFAPMLHIHGSVDSQRFCVFLFLVKGDFVTFSTF